MHHLQLPGPELEGGPRSRGYGASVDIVVLGVDELRPDQLVGQVQNLYATRRTELRRSMATAQE